MLASTQPAGNTEKEDLTTFVAIPVETLKNPDHNNVRVVQNIVIKQLPDGTICLAEAPEEKQNINSELYQSDCVPLKLLNESSDKPSVKNRTILLHPPKKPVQEKLQCKTKQEKQPKKLEPKPHYVQYKCIKCDKCFNTVMEYHSHIKWHKCQKKYKCDKCSSGYNKENNLKIHVVLTHSEETVMECPICHVSLTSQRAASLKSHLMLHHVEEFYTCDECDGEFEKEDTFIKHMETHAAKKSTAMPLTCSYCKLEFKEMKEFRSHVSDHVKLRKTFLKNRRPRKPGGRKEDSKFICVICGKGFIKNSLLERHQRIHSGEKPFKCQYCDRSFTQKGTLQIHISKHTGVKPFACTLCPARFNQKGNLGVHVKKTHTFPTEKTQMYKCSQCTCIFKKIGTLNGHVTKAHLNNGDTAKLDDNLIEDVMSKLKELEKQTLGNTSSKSTDKNKENEPKKHIIIENKTVDMPNFEKQNFINLTESTSDGTIRKYLVRQKKIGDVRWYFCNYCSKQCKKPSDLIRHMRVHTKEKPFKCQQCSSEFTLKSTLLAHAKTHTNKLNYTCKVCNSVFVSLRVLNAHIRKHEFESLPKWQCVTCGFLFDEFEQGVKHRENVKQDKPHIIQPFMNHILKQPLYQTTYGSLAFKPPKMRFPNTGSESPTLRPFHCTICDARFTRRINLKRHIQFHNGDRNFKCHLCPKAFITSYRLKEHLKFHNNVKNYACKLCDKKFVTATLLKRHTIIHNNHKPYQCPYCAKTFKTLLLCRTHIKKVHKKEVVSKLSLEPETLLIAPETNSMDVLSVSTENTALQDLPQGSNTNSTVISQLLPEGEQCVEIMNSEGAITDLTSYPTIYVNMNDLQFLDTSSLSLNANDPQLKLESTESPLINDQNNIEVNDIIFNIDSLKPSLSLPPEEIFETSSAENQTATALPSISEISSKPVKLNGFVNATVGDKSENLSSLLTNNSNLYPNISFNNYLNMPISVAEGTGSFDSTGSSTVLQLAAPADLSQSDEIYETTNIICISCNRMFVSFDTFQGHDCTSLTGDTVNVVGSRTEQLPVELVSNCDENLNDFEKEEDGGFKCGVCDKLFSDKSPFEDHLSTHAVKSNYISGISKVMTNGRSLYLKHLPTSGSGGAAKSCKFCLKEFKKPSDLKRHLRTHTGEKPFVCTMCGRSFSLKSTLESHVKTHDPAPKQFSCDVCNSFFSSKSSLKVHMTIHTGHKPHKCAFCEQKFRTLSNKNSHEMLIHLSTSKKSRTESKQSKVKSMLVSVASGIVNSLNEIQPSQSGTVENGENTLNVGGVSEKIVTENVSPERVTTVSTTENLLSTLEDDQIQMDPVFLLQQLQMSGLILTNEPVSTLLLDDGTILNVEGTKDTVPEISLQEVEAPTTVTGNINVAVKTEKMRNLECDICHKMYASKDVLRKHRKKVHGVNKNYPCIKCDRAFDTQDELSRHNKWHAGYRPYSCLHCTNSFTDESGLKIHMKRMHQHSNATKTTTSALLDVNFDLSTENIDDPLLNNLFTFKKI